LAEEHPQLLRLVEIIRRLRAPGGCPWDRKQSLESLTTHLLEEGHELVEAIDHGVDAKVREEAGDLLMVIVMLCQVAEDEGRFDLEAAAESISEKLVRRHPHVFGPTHVEGAEEVLYNWEKIKAQERRERSEDTSALSGVPAAMPALLRALRIGEKAARVGFDWPEPQGALRKVREELGELEAELAEGPAPGAARGAEELGDLLFAAANLGRLMGVDPEQALRRTLDRFTARFQKLERDLGKPVAEASFEELDAAWEAAKRALDRDAGRG